MRGGADEGLVPRVDPLKRTWYTALHRVGTAGCSEGDNEIHLLRYVYFYFVEGYFVQW